MMADPYEGIVEKAIQQAEEMGIKVSVAVVDQHGNLVAFRRMEGAILASVRFSQGKALTSAMIPMSTSSFYIFYVFSCYPDAYETYHTFHTLF